MSETSNSVLIGLVSQVAKDLPDLREIMDQVKDGHLSEMDGLKAMSEVIASDADLNVKLQTLLRGALIPAVEDQAIPQDHGGQYVHKPRGLPQLNPLMEAALIERAQFDDDMPELRTGPMPRGVMPAMGIDTDVRDPALLGVMLKQASEQTAGLIEAQEPQRMEFIQAMADATDESALALLQESGSALQTADEARDLVFDGKISALDIPEYTRGSIPAPVEVAVPSGSAFLAMTPQERKQGAWKFFSTTQGRCSALHGLTPLIKIKLQSEGFEVEARDLVTSPPETILAYHEWTVGIDGPGAMQPAFSLVDMAAMVLAKSLTKKMGTHRGSVVLEVFAINTVDIRSVGWAARLLSTDPVLSETVGQAG